MIKGSFELSVSIPKDGRSNNIREYGLNGFTYVESREGQKFSIKIRNNTANRVLVVPSIDDVSVLDGEPATSESRGYILAAYSSTEVKGWRTSLEDINDFVFERKDGENTYAQSVSGSTANCGVIAVKIFAEKPKPAPTIVREEHHHHHWPHPRSTFAPHPWRQPYTPYEPVFYCSNAGVNATTNATAGQEKTMSGALRSMSLKQVNETTCQSTPVFDMGTGFGEAQKDYVTEAYFDRGSELATLEIYYTSAAALRAIGVDVDKKPAVNVMPQAFKSGFCKPPVKPTPVTGPGS